MRLQQCPFPNAEMHEIRNETSQQCPFPNAGDDEIRNKDVEVLNSHSDYILPVAFWKMSIKCSCHTTPVIMNVDF